jgi:hypothetical protein
LIFFSVDKLELVPEGLHQRSERVLREGGPRQPPTGEKTTQAVSVTTD